MQKQRSKWVVRQSGYDASTGGRRVRQLGTFDTKRAALAHLKDIANRQVGGADETVADFLRNVWLPSKTGRVEKSTLNQYTWSVERHIVPYLGSVRLADLTPELVDGWIGTLVTPPADGGKRKLGATSVRLCRKVLSMALEEAVQRGHLLRNPVPLTQPPKRERPQRRLGWTIDEARTFLESVDDHRLAALFHLALVTGMRRGELLGLRWLDVDLNERTITVSQQLAVEDNKPIFKQLKTESSERVVTFGPAVGRALQRHQEQQQAEASFAGDAWEDSGLVFTTALGGQLDPQNMGRMLDGLCKVAGVPRITPKGLRHTAQSVGRVVVGDDKVMQERLGHADIGVTLNTYTFVVDEQHRRAGDRIDQAFAR